MESFVDIDISSYASSSSSDNLYCSGTFELDTDSVQTQSLSLSSLSVGDSGKENSSFQSSLCNNMSTKHGSNCVRCSIQPTITARAAENKAKEQKGAESLSIICNSDDDDESLSDFIFGNSSMSLSSYDSDDGMKVDSDIYSVEEKRYNRLEIEQGLLDVSFEELFTEYCEIDDGHDSVAVEEVNSSDSQGEMRLLQKNTLLSCNNQENKQVHAYSKNCDVGKVEKTIANSTGEASVTSNTNCRSRNSPRNGAKSNAKPPEIIAVHCTDKIVLNRIKKKYRSDPIKFRRKKHHIQYSDGRIGRKKGHIKKKFHQRKRSNENEADLQHLLSSYTDTKTRVSSQEKYLEGPCTKSRLSESSMYLAKKLVQKIKHRHKYSPIYSSDEAPLKISTAYDSFTTTYEQYSMVDSPSEASEEETSTGRSWTLALDQRLWAIEELDEESNQGNLAVGELDEDFNEDIFTFDKYNDNNVLSYQCSFPDGMSVEATFPNALDSESKTRVLDNLPRGKTTIPSEIIKPKSTPDQIEYLMEGGHKRVKIKASPKKISNHNILYSGPSIDSDRKRDDPRANEKVVISKEPPSVHDSAYEHCDFLDMNGSFVNLSSTDSYDAFNALIESNARNQEVEVSLMSKSCDKQSQLVAPMMTVEAFDPCEKSFESSPFQAQSSVEVTRVDTRMNNEQKMSSLSSSFGHASPIWTQDQEGSRSSHIDNLLVLDLKEQKKSNTTHKVEGTNAVIREDPSWNEQFQSPSISSSNLQLGDGIEYKKRNVNELTNYFEQELGSRKLENEALEGDGASWEVHSNGNGERTLNSREFIKQTNLKSSLDEDEARRDERTCGQERTDIEVIECQSKCLQQILQDGVEVDLKQEHCCPKNQITTISWKGRVQDDQLNTSKPLKRNGEQNNFESIEKLIAPSPMHSSKEAGLSSQLKSRRRVLPSVEESYYHTSRGSFRSVETKETFVPSRPNSSRILLTIEKYNQALLPKKEGIMKNTKMASRNNRTSTDNTEDRDCSPTHSPSRTSRMKKLIPAQAQNQEHEKVEQYDPESACSNIQNKLQSRSRSSSSVLKLWERAKLQVELEKISTLLKIEQ